LQRARDQDQVIQELKNELDRYKTEVSDDASQVLFVILSYTHNHCLTTNNPLLGQWLLELLLLVL